MNIKQKLIGLCLLISLVPVLAVSYIAYATIRDEITTKTYSQLNSIAVKQQQKINALLQRKQESVIKLSNKFDFQVALRSYLANKQQNDYAQIMDILRSTKAEVQDIYAIHVSNLDQTIIASTTEDTVGSKSDDQQLLDQSGQDTAIALRPDPEDGVNKLYITTKLIADKNEISILTIVFRVEDIAAAVGDYTGLGASGETEVAMKAAGGGAVSLFPLRFDQTAALKTKLNILQLADKTDQRAASTTDYRGTQVLAVVKPIGFADWTLATKIDRKEAFAQATQLRNTLAVIVLIISVSTSLIALWFTRSFTGPVLQLARVSEKIGSGNLSARVLLRRKDELGELGKSINTMGTSLKGFVSRIEAERNRLEVILNSAAESILAINKEGVILLANQPAAKLANIPITQLVGKQISHTFACMRDGKPFIVNYAAAGTNIYEDLQFTDVTGDVHYLTLVVAQVDSAEGQKTAQTIVTITDETKSRELESMKVDFVSMAAHELRTPLAAVQGYLEMVSYRTQDLNQPDINKYITQARKSAVELAGLISNLLDVTRIERGTLTLNPERMDLAADIAQAVQNVRFTAEGKGITLAYNGPPNGCFVIADQIALHEVVNNLLSNAVKYTHHGGHVEAALHEENGSYVVDIKDTGIGIPKHAIANLFTKFYRVNGGLSGEMSGTGLGLFIAKSIIERHGGTIHAESEEGIGSVFTFTLPSIGNAPQAFAANSSQQQTTTRWGLQVRGSGHD